MFVCEIFSFSEKLYERMFFFATAKINRLPCFSAVGVSLKDTAKVVIYFKSSKIFAEKMLKNIVLSIILHISIYLVNVIKQFLSA